jgi:hypothetical protein
MSSGRFSEQFSEHSRGHCEQERRQGSARMLMADRRTRMGCMIVSDDDEDLTSYTHQPHPTWCFMASFPI